MGAFLTALAAGKLRHGTGVLDTWPCRAPPRCRLCCEDVLAAGDPCAGDTKQSRGRMLSSEMELPESKGRSLKIRLCCSQP